MSKQQELLEQLKNNLAKNRLDLASLTCIELGNLHEAETQRGWLMQAQTYATLHLAYTTSLNKPAAK